jgi:hypothetical protein
MRVHIREKNPPKVKLCMSSVNCSEQSMFHLHKEKSHSYEVVEMEKTSRGCCNAPKSKRLRSTLYMLSESHLPPSHLHFRTRFA